MIIEATTVNGCVDPKHEIVLECAHCGLEVDAIEYKQEMCNDCGNPWQQKKHTAIYVTSQPLSGHTV